MVWGIGSEFLLALSMGVLTYWGFQPSGPLRVGLHAYIHRLERELRYINVRLSARHWGCGHVLVICLWGAATVGLRSIPMLLGLPVLLVIPIIYATHKRSDYSKALEAQVGPWALLLAANLNASPSIYDALKASIGRTRYPIRDEAKRVVRDISLGAPLARALESSSDRIQNPIYSATITTLAIGGHTGGHLPSILQELAENLREMERLQGVIRVKTAEGKTQAYVLAVIPFLMASFMQFSDPQYISFFTSSMMGKIALVAAILFWLGAVLSARRILRVDI